MHDIEEFSDERLKGWCVHCAASIATSKTSWDHVPTKGLLDRPLPAHVPQVEICALCNNEFSLDEEYLVTFLSCVLSGSTSPEAQINEKIGRALKRNPGLQRRIEASRKPFTTHGGEERVVWNPEQSRINRIVAKNARGHAFYEFGEPKMEEPASLNVFPLVVLGDEQRAAFERTGAALWPEVGSRMMTRVITGQDMIGGWVVVQEGVYRYAVYQDGGLVVKSVIREYLATEVCWD